MADGERTVEKPRPGRRRIRRGPLGFLGPGLIAGASDDDPSGIATYSQVGAQFGYGMAWLLLFSYPLMAAIQEISARIGRVTGHGIAGNIRAHHSAALLRAVVALLVIANVINLGADLGAMAEALRLIVGGPAQLYVVGFAVLCAGLEVFARYARYVMLLKWLTVSLLAYVATVLVVEVPWGEVAYRTVVPELSWDRAHLVAIVAVLGTTISPYLFFWQASQEAEDAHGRLLRLRQASAELMRIRVDTYVGMGLSNLVALFIVITTAATLHAHGVTDIQTSAQAAEALRPIAGSFAFVLFAAGIIGTGLLAIPVLAGSAAYALGEAFRWPIGLARRPRQAKAFYAAVALATMLGTLIDVVALDPIKALFWSAVLNGIVAVPVMVVMMRIAVQPAVMGRFVLPRSLWLMGWLATAAMAVTVATMFATALG
ncbi:MAG: divalent metal cation transporter [Proteobacteria bacterium]|nr:divalent metal cation transporter [Pseudomonadota bacterium]